MRIMKHEGKDRQQLLRACRCSALPQQQEIGLEEAESSKEISRTTSLTPSHPAARTHHQSLAVLSHLNCKEKTTRKYADRPKNHPPNIKWTLHWLDLCKYQLLDRFLDTSTHQKQNTETGHWTAHLSQQLHMDPSSVSGWAFPTKPHQFAYRCCQEHTRTEHCEGWEVAPEQHPKLSLNEEDQDGCFEHKHLLGSQWSDTIQTSHSSPCSTLTLNYM